MAPQEVSARGSSDEDELDRLLLLALERSELGGDSAVEQVLRDHPQHAAALRRRIESLRAAGLWDPVEASAATGVAPEQLGEFRLERVLGAGGMGVVYLALQESLGRRVALKIVRPEHLYFPGARERFRREVETVARLQHPGIVPVYAVGEHAGVPYFAMEYIPGRTVDACLRRLAGRSARDLTGADFAPEREAPNWLFEGSWESACLRVVRAVAEALEHSHQRGVLHRDIKPSNILLATEGASRALLFDFGLASATDRSRLTRTGARLGSLHYMSPEQTRDALVDVRSDVYSLGVTLYEMLTLQRAFSGQSDIDVVRAIHNAERRRPRELNPSIGVDAESVCLKAMDADPSRRYPTAASFARDLANVLERRPVEARPASAWRVTSAWVRRHPSRTAAFALGALLVAGVPTLYAWQQRSAAVSLGAQRDRAERNFEKALQTVDRLLGRVGAEDLRYTPGMERLRRRLLEDAVALLQELVASGENVSEARGEVARAFARLGALHADLGDSRESAAAFERAVDHLQEMCEASPGDLDLRERLVEGLLQLSRSLTLAGDSERALAAQQRGTRQLAHLLASEAPPPRSAALECRLQVGLARIQAATGDYQLARTNFAAALAKCSALADATEAELSTLVLERDVANEYGLLLIEHFSTEGKPDPLAVEILQRAEHVAERVAARDDSDPAARHAHAETLINLGGAYRRAGAFDEVTPLYQRAAGLLEKLAADFRDTLSYQVELAAIENQLGLLIESTESARDGRDVSRSEALERCAAHYRAALARLEDVVARAPRELEFRQRAGISGYNLATALQFSDVPQALKVVARAIEHQGVALELAPRDPVVREDLRALLQRKGSLCLKAGDHAEAARVSLEMVTVLPDDYESHRSAAYRLTRCVAHVRENAELTAEARSALVQRYCELAVERLQAALALGYQPSAPLGEHEDFEPLRDAPQFKALLAQQP